MLNTIEVQCKCEEQRCGHVEPGTFFIQRKLFVEDASPRIRLVSAAFRWSQAHNPFDPFDGLLIWEF